MNQPLPGDMPGLADFFRGRWRFVRTIWEGDGTPQAEAIGESEFAQGDQPRQLIYREHGALRMLAIPSGSSSIAFTRVFDYRFRPEDVDVLFADGERVGQPYQRYRLESGFLKPVAGHLCGPDCYNARYALENQDAFSMETFILGPKKHTRLLTCYQRCKDAGQA